MEARLHAGLAGRLELLLQENQPLALRRARHRRVGCVSGRLLITAFGEPADIELHPGQSYVVPNHGLTLVEGVGRAVMRLERAQPSSSAALPGATAARLARLLRPFLRRALRAEARG
ncbi:Protein of unknown function [Noviherbaspirillum humi]|uniref:AraC-binding-like domain-containing protein n=2 Tax=Noviherbaspirillum humi TaxID=1688639 RepID=A0A239GIH4_9BURK|nr:Protein of unknown function [Noviherbaspirillum humi]